MTNITVGEAITSDDIPTLEDFGQRRRQRDRKRYAQMCVQQKEKLLKKRRENYQQKKTGGLGRGSSLLRLLLPPSLSVPERNTILLINKTVSGQE